MLGLAIIAKNESEVTDEIKSYYKHFDKVIVAVDDGEAHDEFMVYVWSEAEQVSGMLDFARKRNFVHSMFDGFDYYFTIDTDDVVPNIDELHNVVCTAKAGAFDVVYFPYHYSRDEFGNVNAIHNKERLIRPIKELRWNKSIHENVLPISGFYHNILICEDIIVIHNVDHSHADRSYDRNIRYMIDEWNRDKETTDPRTLAYLGRCFMARQDFPKAVYFLRKHVECSGWDEDRCMSLCQLSDIYRQNSDYEAAIKYAYLALDERHDYPEPYLKLHDVYTETCKWDKAIYWGEIGAKIKPPKTFMITDPSYSGWRLALSLSYCYMMKGEIEIAYRLFKIAQNKAGDLPFIKENAKEYEKQYYDKQFIDRMVYLASVLEERASDKIKYLVKAIPSDMSDNPVAVKLKNVYLEPKVWSDKSIVIVCGYTLDEWSPKSLATGIGGSEEAVIHISEELTKHGYEVTVYNGCGRNEGTYNGVNYVNFEKLNPRDNFNIIIGWRSNIFREHHWCAHYRYVWLHDIYQDGTCDDYTKYDAIIVLSQFHKSLLPAHIPDSKVIVSANGINILIDTSNIKREPKRIIYASSYDRGLERLLERWSEVRVEHPDAELHVYYGWNNIDKLVTTGQHRHLEVFKEKMLKLLAQPGVFEHGRIGHDELHREFARSGVWAYPSHFEEISCITAMKAQVLGCTPVCTDYAALKETVKSGVIVKGKADDKAVMDEFITKLNLVLSGKITIQKTDYDFGWAAVASQWKDEFERRLFKPNQYGSISDYKEVYSNMSEDNVTLVDKNIMTERYNFALDKMIEHGCKTLLDVGTFDGALAVYASRIGIKSTGVDINTTFIEAGKNCCDASKCKLIGGVAFEEFETCERFDCVSATEVIEHVMDVDSFLKKCHSFLNDGGIVTISTPYRLGRYGITNHDVHHIRHYDLEMLETDTSKYFITKELKVNGDLINFCGIKK